jgi:hypothetical protein
MRSWAAVARPAESQQPTLGEVPKFDQTVQQGGQASVPAHWQQVGRTQAASADALLQEASKSRADFTGEAAWCSPRAGEGRNTCRRCRQSCRRLLD